jgi:hypothetical protein
VADELSVDAEHAHAVVVELDHCDVTVARHEAQPYRLTQLTIAITARTEPTKKSAVAAVEHTDAIGGYRYLRHNDDVGVRTHSDGTT